MSFDLRDSVSVVTGAASGIGRAVALAFAARGGHLALTDLDAEGLARSRALAHRFGVRVTTHHMDVTDAAAVATLPARVVDAHGRVTVLVNNAGVALTGDFADVGLDDVRWVLDVNLHAVIAHTHAFLPVLRTQRAAHIVLLSSMFGLVAPAGQTAYATAKFGVRGFGEALRHELAGSNVGVTLVHPAGVMTAIARRSRVAAGTDPEAAASAIAEFERRFLRMTPERAAERIARAIERRRPRLLMGTEAYVGDAVARLLPARYWSVLGRLAPPPP